MKRVIIGFDAHEASHDALQLAIELVAATGAQLHVAVVLPRGRIPFEEALVEPEVSRQLDDVLFDAAAQRLEGSGFTRASLDGGLSGRSAARALYEYADEVRADLIVVGSSHRGPIGRVLAGSVGESLLRGAPCAVAVAPRGYADREHPTAGRIGVAYDGTVEANLALGEGLRLADSLGARLRVITVVPEMTAWDLDASAMSALLNAQRREYRRILDGAVVAGRDDASIERVLLNGDPASVLAAQGAELDLLVVGSRGYGPVRGALLGAVSAALMRIAPCPVLVTPRGSVKANDEKNGEVG